MWFKRKKQKDIEKDVPIEEDNSCQDVLSVPKNAIEVDKDIACEKGSLGFSADLPSHSETDQSIDVSKRDSVLKPNKKRGLWSGLSKTREAFFGLFSGQKIDEVWLDDLEDQMLMSDVGVESTMEFMDDLRLQVKQNKASTADDVVESLQSLMHAKLTKLNDIKVNKEHPLFVLLMVGINGVGKTTTTAKLARQYQNEGKSVMLAACDTYRAAAIEQLQTWGQRLNVPVISHEHGADAAAVAHDAYQSALAKKCDVLIIDTAGRQHTHKDLMDQLGKIKRVLTKLDASLPHESWIVLDAGNGQNVLSQIDVFSQYTPLSGVCLTKLDGTAKGGIVFAIADKFHLPVRYVGVGEAMDDLLPFNQQDFIDALVSVKS